MGHTAISRRTLSQSSHVESLPSKCIKKKDKDFVKIFGKVTEYGGISLAVVAAILALASAIFSGLFVPATFLVIAACSVFIPAFLAALSLIVSRILKLPCRQKKENEGVENLSQLKKREKASSGTSESNLQKSKESVKIEDGLKKDNKKLSGQVESLRQELKEANEKHLEINVNLEEEKGRSRMLEVRLEALSKSNELFSADRNLSASASPSGYRRNENERKKEPSSPLRAKESN